MLESKNTFDSEGLSTTTQSNSNLGTDATRFGCLVVGMQESRRDLLSHAAETAGWDTVECDNHKTARTRALRDPQQMVIVDLESVGGSSPSELKMLAERFSRSHKNTLLVLCGNEGNSLEEIWARQLGVWLYLPGVVADSDLGSLFEEAHKIVDRRRSGPAPANYYPRTAAGA